MEKVNNFKIIIGIIMITIGLIILIFELLWWHTYQTGWIGVGAISVILMIGGLLLIIRGQNPTIKSSIMRISSYFSERIEEIQKGAYVPSYRQVKELPEFSGINQRDFRIARKKWYRQNFQTTFFMASSRLENIKAMNLSEQEYDKMQIKRKRNKGKGLIVCGASLLIFTIILLFAVPPFLFSSGGGLGYVGIILFIIIGLFCIGEGIIKRRVKNIS
jgi:hypothetical protein